MRTALSPSARTRATADVGSSSPPYTVPSAGVHGRPPRHSWVPHVVTRAGPDDGSTAGRTNANAATTPNRRSRAYALLPRSRGRHAGPCRLPTGVLGAVGQGH